MKYTEAYWAGKAWDEYKGTKPPKSIYVANCVMLAGCVSAGESYCAYAHPWHIQTTLTREQARNIRCISGVGVAWDELEETGTEIDREHLEAGMLETTRERCLAGYYGDDPRCDIYLKGKDIGMGTRWVDKVVPTGLTGKDTRGNYVLIAMVAGFAVFILWFMMRG